MSTGRVCIEEVGRWEAHAGPASGARDPIPRDKELRNFGRVFKTLDTLEATAACEDDFAGPILTPLLFAQVLRLGKG